MKKETTGSIRDRNQSNLRPTALILEVAIATNIVLALVAVVLLVLGVALVGFWENSTTWRQAPQAPVIEPQP